MTKVWRLQKKISDLYLKIKEMQDNCEHPEKNLISKSRSDTGNYDPSYDVYWTEFHCLTCDKRWTVEQK